jgi:hypothetical protein
MILAAALAAQIALAPCKLEGGSVDGLDQRCAADNPAPPFLLSGTER